MGHSQQCEFFCLRNLDHRPERWEFMQKQFQKLRMPVERLLTGDTLNL